MQTITLKEWMDEKGYTSRTLAERMELSYAYIYKLTTETVHGKPIGLSFERRFEKCFGLEEAARLFGAIPQTEVG